MDKPEKERREMSLAGLLDSAMRTIGQLVSSSDTNTRNLAIRALGDIKRAQRQIPARRKLDAQSRVA